MVVAVGSMPLLVGIGGGAASGKTEACRKIKAVLEKKSNEKLAVTLSLSAFYRELSVEERLLDAQGGFDYAHPNSFDFTYLSEVLQKIQRRERVTIRPHEGSVHFDAVEAQEIPAGVDVAIVEGILTFYQKEIRDMFDVKIFIESDADTRLCRKVLRDVSRNGRPLKLVLDTYFKYVKPAFEEFCLPTKKYADVILPKAPDNNIGIELITEHIIQLINAASMNAPASCMSRARNQSDSCVGSIRPH